VHVEQQQVNWFAFNDVQSLFAIAGLNNPEATIFKYAAQRLAKVAIVISDQQ